MSSQDFKARRVGAGCAEKSGKAVWRRGLISEACGELGDFHSNRRPQIIKTVFSLLLFPALRIEPGIKHILCIYLFNEKICFKVHTKSILLGLNICVALKMSVNVRTKCLEFL